MPLKITQSQLKTAEENLSQAEKEIQEAERNLARVQELNEMGSLEKELDAM